MGFIEWATSPLGQNVPIHIAWFLIWVALIASYVPRRACDLRPLLRQKKRNLWLILRRRLRLRYLPAFPGTLWSPACFIG